ncbi:MAG: hypothetical protein H8D38_01915 [DPANN group archaeon]|nr:hypothetical protein [DPANN group archaeon]
MKRIFNRLATISATLLAPLSVGWGFTGVVATKFGVKYSIFRPEGMLLVLLNGIIGFVIGVFLIFFLYDFLKKKICVCAGFVSLVIFVAYSVFLIISAPFSANIHETYALIILQLIPLWIGFLFGTMISSLVVGIRKK